MQKYKAAIVKEYAQKKFQEKMDLIKKKREEILYWPEVENFIKKVEDEIFWLSDWAKIYLWKYWMHMETPKWEIAREKAAFILGIVVPRYTDYNLKEITDRIEYVLRLSSTMDDFLHTFAQI